MPNAKRLAISPDSFTGVLDAMQVPYVVQSGFVRVEGPEGRRMYVGRGRITTTVHLSGFTSEHGARDLQKSPSARVQQEMDWPAGLSAVEQLRLFRDLVAFMLSLDARPKGARPAASPAPVPVLVDASLVLGEESVAQSVAQPVS